MPKRKAKPSVNIAPAMKRLCDWYRLSVRARYSRRSTPVTTAISRIDIEKRRSAGGSSILNVPV